MSKDDLEADKEALVQGYVEGTLTPAEIARLQALLLEDPLLARVIMENLQMDGAIREIAGAESLPAVAPHPKLTDSQRIKSTRRFRTVRTAGPVGNWNPLVLASVAALVLIGFLFILTSGTPESDSGIRARRVKRVELERRMRENQERVRRAEEILQQNQRRRESLFQPPTTPVSEEKKKQDLQTLDAERTKVEEELKDAIRKFNEAKEEIERPEPAESVIVKEPPAPAGNGTVAANATILPDGEVYVVKGEEKTLLQGARALAPGEGLETGAGAAQARIVFPDRSLVLVGPDSRIGKILGGTHKLVDIVRGSLRAQVMKQSGSMSFASPYGEAKVLGTSLRIVVDPSGPGSMRLEVTEGKVQLQRLLDKKTVDVLTGHYAIAAAGAELVSRTMPIDDVVLFPSQGSVSGSEWQSVEDPLATSGYALEAVLTSPRNKSANSPLVVKTRPDHVAFTFPADTYRDYSVRIKGGNLGAVAVSIPGAVVKPALPGMGAYPLPNFAANSGYVWVGGEGNTATLSVRFQGVGSRTLKLYAAEAPVRVDSIWLSAIKSASETMLEKNGQLTFIFGPETRQLPNDTEYVLDTAKEFDASRGFGWSAPLPWTDVDLTKPKTDLQASFVAGGGKTASHSWVFLIPNGKYLVSACCGGYTRVVQGPHMVRIQEKVVVNRLMTDPGKAVPSPEVPVEVKDGRLVMTIAGHQSNFMPPDTSDDTLLNYLKIRRAK